MGRNPARDANDKAKREMQEAVDKVIADKKEPIGAQEAKEKVAADLKKAALKDTGNAKRSD